MGCGCGKRKNGKDSGMTQTIVPAHVAGPSSIAAAGDGYSGGLGCRMCYAKHLAKASVELSEYLEDNSRYSELAMFVGDVACAGDHASALGEQQEAAELRNIRRSAMSSPSRAMCDRLREMASAQLKSIRGAVDA